MRANVSRANQIRSGVNIEVFTVIWMAVEAIVSIGAGLLAHSALLTAFGLDSVIELVSGGILLWRLLLEARGAATGRVDRAERQAAWVVAAALALLCLYVFGTALFGLLTRATPESSLAGMLISLSAIVVMPWLAVLKTRLAKQIDSGALRGDAASSWTCAYMAGTVLVGLALNAWLQWWWAEDLAALIFLFWLVQETREAFEAARSGPEHDEGTHPKTV